jgi:hypothetical protein
MTELWEILQTWQLEMNPWWSDHSPSQFLALLILKSPFKASIEERKRRYSFVLSQTPHKNLFLSFILSRNLHLWPKLGNGRVHEPNKKGNVYFKCNLGINKTTAELTPSKAAILYAITLLFFILSITKRQRVWSSFTFLVCH